MTQEEAIEKSLLDAMSGIDNAVWRISGESRGEEFPEKDIQELLECKSKIKKILQGNYDPLARAKKH